MAAALSAAYDCVVLSAPWPGDPMLSRITEHVTTKATRLFIARLLPRICGDDLTA
jgi:hypothetical protein